MYDSESEYMTNCGSAVNNACQSSVSAGGGCGGGGDVSYAGLFGIVVGGIGALVKAACDNE